MNKCGVLIINPYQAAEGVGHLGSRQHEVGDVYTVAGKVCVVDAGDGRLPVGREE